MPAVEAEGEKDHLDEGMPTVKVEKAPREKMIIVTDRVPTPPSESPNKRKVEFKSAVKIEDGDSDGQEYMEVSFPLAVKKIRTTRGVAMKEGD
jgi:hypothetical protein